jgi:site-specific DNA-methyltransferase (adenine-specific)
MNSIHLGNSIDVLKTIEDKTIDLTVTSPPYDNLRTYNDKIKDGVSYEGGFSFPFVEMATELFRVTKVGGVVVWVVNDQVKKGGETGSSFRQALKFMDIGFTLYDTMIYHKNGPPFPESGRYSQVFEYMFVFSKGKPKTINLIKDKPNRWAGYTNFGDPSKRTKEGELVKVDKFKIGEFGTRYNVWYINTGSGFSSKDEFAHQHPAIFPESLAEDHILSWTNEGDIVLDPMCGSGTTLKMSKVNNRNYIGIDINEEYVELSKKRIENVSPYTEENPNPKNQYIVTQQQMLDSRNETRLKNIELKKIAEQEKNNNKEENNNL